MPAAISIAVCSPTSKPRIDWFTLEREHAEHALVNATQRFASDEPLQTLNAQRKFPQGERSLGREATIPQPLEVFRREIVGTVNQPEVFRTATLHGWLQQATPARSDEGQWLDDHAFSAPPHEIGPPLNRVIHFALSAEVDDAVWRREQNVRSLVADLTQHVHVPRMVTINVNGTLRRHDVKRCKADVLNSAHWPAVATVRIRELCYRDVPFLEALEQAIHA